MFGFQFPMGGMGMGGPHDPFGHDDDDHEEDDDMENGDGGNQEIDNKDLYNLLDLQPGASIEEVRRAYKKKALKAHPDRGGDAEEFRKLTAAVDILSDENKKKIYDKYGMKGLEKGQGGNPFAEFFGFGGQQDKNAYKKMKPKVLELRVSLEDVFLGKMVTQKVNVKKICDGCSGEGGKNQKVCEGCKGRKVMMGHVQIGPGMYAQTPIPCESCKGKGSTFEEGDICEKCKGEQILEVEKDLEVALEKGCPHGFKINLTGVGDEFPGVNAGDIIFSVLIEPHDRFIRKGADLYYSQKISLKEALVGTHFQIKHLDDETLFVVSNQITKPNQIKTIQNKGMPFYKDQMSYGNLYVQFEVEFPAPDSLSQEQITQLAAVLPGPPKAKIPEGVQTYELAGFSQEQTNENVEGGKVKEDDSDDERKHGPQVQCAQQ